MWRNHKFYFYSLKPPIIPLWCLLVAEQRLHKNRSWAWSETVQNHKQDIMAANQELCGQKFNSKSSNVHLRHIFRCEVYKLRCQNRLLQ